jgi:hypothetical protein
MHSSLKANITIGNLISDHGLVIFCSCPSRKREHPAVSPFFWTRDMQGRSKYSETQARIHAHRLRCKSLAPMQVGESARLVADFLATREVTSCPTRYAMPVEQWIQPLRSAH